jgi:hypothetical protein
MRYLGAGIHQSNPDTIRTHICKTPHAQLTPWLTTPVVNTKVIITTTDLEGV